MSLFEQVVDIALRNHYGVDMGTGGLIVQAQTRQEILADKLVALALRPNRLKNRDLWDMIWLHQQGVELPLALLPLKLRDHQCDIENFLFLLKERCQALSTNPALRDDFRRELRRFLPAALTTGTVDNPDFWTYLVNLTTEYCQGAKRFLEAGDDSAVFGM